MELGYIMYLRRQQLLGDQICLVQPPRALVRVTGRLAEHGRDGERPLVRGECLRLTQTITFSFVRTPRIRGEDRDIANLRRYRTTGQAVNKVFFKVYYLIDIFFLGGGGLIHFFTGMFDNVLIF